MHRRTLLAVALWLAIAPTSVIWGDTFVIPHILEKSGKTSNTPFTFDTTIFAQYTPTSGGSGQATTDFYLYDRSTGQIMQGPAGDVCNPCSFQDTTAANHEMVIDDEMAAVGAFDSGKPFQSGFMLVQTSGDTSGVNVQGFVVNAHTSAFDLSVFGFEPQPIEAAATVRSFVLPHVLEKSGKTVLAGNELDQGGSADTLLYPTYVGGLLGIPASSATLELTLYNTDGTRMLSGGAAYDYQTLLSDTNRSPLVSLEDIINSAGGFGGAIKEGYLDVSITGDAGNVAIQGFVVNSHTGPFDLSFAPVPEPTTAGLLTIAGACLPLYWWRRKARRTRDED